MRTKAFFLVLILTLILFSCENRQDVTVVNLGFKAVSGQDEMVAVAKGSKADGILIDTAIIILDDIVLKSQDGTSDMMLMKGPFIIDLLTARSEPPIMTTDIRPGIYNGLDARLVVLPALEFSIFISGTYTLNDSWWKFRYSYTGENGFSVDNEQGLVIDELQTNNIWVLIDVLTLFDGVDFRSAAVNTENVIIINGSTNSNLASIVEANFSSAATITGDDYDGVNSEPRNSGADNDDDGSDNNNNGEDKDKDKDKDKDDKKS